MRKFLFLICLWGHLNVFSQDIEVLNVSYSCLWRTAKEQMVPSEMNYFLSIGNKSSAFYPPQMEIFGRMVDDPYGLSVYKNSPQLGFLSYREAVSTVLYYYTESMPQYQWEVLEGDSVICDYSCQKARTTFRGRTWIVWYSMDLPYADGPWKLCGLPGLILKAEDSEGDFSFTAYKIAKGSQKEIKMDLGNAKKVTFKELEKEVDNNMRHPLEKLNSGKVTIDFSGAPELKPQPQTPCRMEIVE